MSGSGSPEKSFIEEWHMENDSSFTGNGYIVNESTGDRFNSEQLRLNYRKNTWIYTAEPNGTSSTEFKATEVGDDLLLFENKEHDFPQFIKYELISEDSIQVVIGDTNTSKTWIMVRSR